MKQFSPSAQRNREPIAEVLREVLPARGTVLEVGSGTGEHVVYFADAFPFLLWQPTDPDLTALLSIRAWVAESDALNLMPPLSLDASSHRWPVDAADAVICVNVLHISPWLATMGLMEGAARLLAPGAPLVLYGPYRRAGVPTAPSNEAFHASLKSRNLEWGVRDFEAVAAEAEACGFGFDRLYEMPANNLTLVFRRR